MLKMIHEIIMFRKRMDVSDIFAMFVSAKKQLYGKDLEMVR